MTLGRADRHRRRGRRALDAGEACDDGNTSNGDGCSNACDVENGYECSGAPSSCHKKCGNGTVNASDGEACDDGNHNNNDGCSSVCKVEAGYICPTAGMLCKLQGWCGDSKLSVAETSAVPRCTRKRPRCRRRYVRAPRRDRRAPPRCLDRGIHLNFLTPTGRRFNMGAMATQYTPTTGIAEVDKAIGGVIDGDNLVWEIDSGVAGDHFISQFVSACELGGIPVVYVSFNRSPQTIAAKYARLMSPGRFSLIDCFSSGKGNSDEMFLKFFDDPARNAVHAPVHIADPADPSRLEQALIDVGTRGGRSANYVFDSLTGMLDLWGDENRVVRLFGHLCPRLYDLSTLAYWLIETEAHSEAFLAKVRHITQVVMEVSLANGQRALTVHKAAGRNAEIGVPQPLDLDEGLFAQEGDMRNARDLDRLTRRGEELRRTYRVDSIVGGSAAIRRLLGLAATAARSRSSVLITGETGTGKELIANVVHYNSERAARAP